MSLINASGIRKIFDKASSLKNIINLSIGEPDFDVADEIKEKAIKAIKDGFNKYTPSQGLLKLREKIAEKLLYKNNIKVTPEEILITSGVSGGLFLVFNTLLNEKDEIIIFDPYFVLYKQIINFIKAKPIFIDNYPHFRLSIEKIKPAIGKNTKAILINSSNNPTGVVYSKEELEKLANLAEKNHLVIISDEIYNSFIYEGRYFSVGSIYNNTITLNGFSKAYGMTGWRIGYVVAHKKIIQEMVKLQQYSFVCIPGFIQEAAIFALDYDISPYILNYRHKRDLAFSELKANFEVEKPEGSFYIFPKLKKSNMEKFIKETLKNKVLIIPGNIFSEKNTNFRLSFATKENVLKEGIEILNKIIKSL